jgi:hypothetical protein
MDWLTFFSKLVAAVSWPAVAAFIFWNIRYPIQDLMNRVTTLKWKDGEASFGERLAEVRAEMTAARDAKVPYNVIRSPSLNDSLGNNDDELVDLYPNISAGSYPIFSIDRSWQKLVGALNSSARSRGINFPSDMRWTKNLCRDLGLSAADEQAIRDLRSLRNIALYDMGTDRKLSRADAMEYDCLVAELMPKIEAVGAVKDEP